LRLTGPTTSSHEEDDDVSTLDFWTCLSSLSVDTEVDHYRRMEEAERNYSTAPLSLLHRQRRQEKQVAEEPRSSGKT
jgi:hypothetical protein